MEASIDKTRHNDRRCIATGEALPPGALALRFVRGPGGAVVPDLRGSLPGRGAWIGASRARLVGAARKKAFSRAFKAPTEVPAEPDAFADQVESLLRDQALRALGLARRAGVLHVGFEAVRERASKLSAYLTPLDASPDGVSKVKGRLAAAGQVPHIVLPVESDVLSGAIGELGAVHLGLARGGPASSALKAVRLWTAFHVES
ncbi:DUF448 domain-containing protein [Parvularcula dongshanensis]|uniref:YlxR domain-containing protein n=1 Tax=Parvularcula dongshanensis TaxID=1173995 RepID=A0A840I1A6_9PROT|nr:DUF448 domain-containing protein [Parvularcula dongshanensis]MBB4657992.1 hypothetical protein [Parvularcula dongshanensis]